MQLTAFLHATQPEAAESLGLDGDGPTRRKFLARLQGEVSKRGSIDVLRYGLKHGAHDLDLFYGTPSAGNDKATALCELNRFTVTRQLRYSRDEAQLALDLGLFINGLPVFTFELNRLTKQTVDDAKMAVQEGSQPAEKLFEFGRCIPLTSPLTIRRCASAPSSRARPHRFLPYNRGWDDGAGNPPQPARPQDRLSVARGARPRA